LAYAAYRDLAYGACLDALSPIPLKSLLTITRQSDIIPYLAITTSNTGVSIPKLIIGARNALSSVPIEIRWALTAIYQLIPYSTTIASQTGESIPILANWTATGVSLSAPKLSIGA
jgi:hypothetical protein